MSVQFPPFSSDKHGLVSCNIPPWNSFFLRRDVCGLQLHHHVAMRYFRFSTSGLRVAADLDNGSSSSSFSQHVHHVVGVICEGVKHD